MDRAPAPTLRDYAAYEALGRSRAPCELAAVTVARNAATTIARTQRSVHAQGPQVRHVVVDGGSTDATLAVLRPDLRAHDILISEPDRGISDAMNKGIAACNAAFVAVIHSDDWLSDSQLALALAHVHATGADFVFGDVDFYKAGRLAHRDRGDPDYAAKVANRMPSVLHPSILFSRQAFERVGLYRTDLKLAMDYEWLLRATSAGLRGAYSPAIIANMTHDGASNTRYPQTMAEVADVAIRYGRPRLRARAEQAMRTAKIFAGRRVERLSPAVFLAVRRRINPQIAVVQE